MHFILLSTLQLCTRPPPLLLFALHLIDFLVKLQLTIVYFGSCCQFYQNAKCTVRVRHILEHWWPHTDINIQRIKDANPDLLHIVAMNLPRPWSYKSLPWSWTLNIIALAASFHFLQTSLFQNATFAFQRASVQRQLISPLPFWLHWWHIRGGANE